MTLSATNKNTGEVVEVDAGTGDEIITAYRAINETIATWEQLKKKLQARAAEYIEEWGELEHDGYAVRSYTTQRMNYPKSALREVFDADELDLFLEPVKTKVDAYLKEHLDELGDASTKLRESMVPAGRPYSVTRLEKL